MWHAFFHICDRVLPGNISSSSVTGTPAALLVDEVVQAVGVISTVSQNLACRNAPDQVAGGCHVVLLAGAQDEADRQTESIDYGVDFGAEPTSRAPESLGLNAPFLSVLRPLGPERGSRSNRSPAI